MSKFLGGKLDNQEIRQRIYTYEFSSGYKPSKELVNSAIEQFWFHDYYNSIISDEWFLAIFPKFLDKHKPGKFNRYDFYAFLINQITENKTERLGLQRIALEFEKAQVDRIKTDAYEHFLEDIEAPDGLFSISWFENKRLAKIVKEDNKSLFAWEHHTLTEFLVAEFLIQQKNSFQEFQKLAILSQEGIVAFKPSWSGVLRFLMESKYAQEITAWLMQFLDEYSDNIDDNLAELLVFEGLNTSKSFYFRIFNLVYNTYFERQVWLPIWTRHRLSRFVDTEIYKRLKTDIKKWPQQTETYVKRSNAIMVIEGLLENKNSLLTTKEKEYWKKTLVNFCNKPGDGGNGVLQRTCLSALAYFKDGSIIPKVAKSCFENTQDSLVRDEFIQLCYNSAPNSRYAIDYLVEGIKKGATIYARHGLYEITTKSAIKYFLKKIIKDNGFWTKFIDHESIFDKEDGDKRLLANITRNVDREVIKLLKKNIFGIFAIPNFYQENKSSFIRKIVQIINKHDSGFLSEILKLINKQDNDDKIAHLFFDFEEILAILLTPQNVAEYFKQLEEIEERHKERVIYTARRINSKIGRAVYQKAVQLKLIEPLNEQTAITNWEKQQEQQKQNKLDEFLRLLEPAPGKYIPSVFEYYTQNQKEFDEFFKTKKGQRAEKRLLKLVLDEGLKKIDPRKFTVTIPNKKAGNSQFTWSTSASYFGDMLSVLKILAPEQIKKYRQKIIDFIPYAFSDDMGQILELVSEISDKDLEFVNKVMGNPKDDRRYLIPSSYIYIVEQLLKRRYRLLQSKEIIKSFIGDQNIGDYNQRSALKTFGLFLNKKNTESKKFLQAIFAKRDKSNHNKQLGNIANSLLISVYEDEEAINWRFKKIKEPLAFEGRKLDGEFHEVGPIENELDTLAFAGPLINLKNETYLPKFLKLLDHSFKLQEEKQGKNYSGYINYIWRIVTKNLENLQETGSFRPLMYFNAWLLMQKNHPNLNWLKLHIENSRRRYINDVNPKFQLNRDLENSIELLCRSNDPAQKIACALFKSQLVEQKLKELLKGLALYTSLITRRHKIKKKVDYDDFIRFTLGDLLMLLNKYEDSNEDSDIKKLRSEISNLNGIRKKFTHHLYEQTKTTQDLFNEAKTSINSSYRALQLMQSVWIKVLAMN